MANVAEQLVALAQPALAPGEEILGAVKVNYNGTVQPPAATSSDGVGGIETSVPAPDADSTTAFPSAQLMGLVLTGGRVMVWALGFTNKPKSYLGEVPISAISEVHAGEVRFGPLMRLVMKSGATVDLEIPHKESGRNDFIDHLAFLVGQGSDSRFGRARSADADEVDPPVPPDPPAPTEF